MKIGRLIGLIFLIFTMLIGCLSEKKNTYYDNEHFFVIKIGRDTLIKTEEGVEIEVLKKTFISDREEVEFSITIFKDKFEMIKNNCITLTLKDEILESDGMLFFRSNDEARINSQFPMKIRIPSDRLASEMKVFTGIEIDGFIKWEEEGPVESNKSILKISEGKKLFEEYCLVCHNKNLRDILTGPALGNISLYRDSIYLRNFTRNSQKLIASGDILSNCLYREYNNSVMTSFEFLEDNQIENIYKYISSESRNLGIGLKEIIYIDSCSQDSAMYYMYDSDGNVIDSALVNSQSDNLGVGSSAIFEDTIKNNISRELDKYQFSISEYGWYNIDMFLNSSKVERIENFEIKLENAEVLDMNGVLIFENRNVIIPFERSGDSYFLKFGSTKDFINFPIGETMRIVFLGSNVANSKMRFAHQKIVSKLEGNSYVLNVQMLEEDRIKKILNE